MIFLALDTSSAYCSIALQANNKVYSKTSYIPKKHNKFLLLMIDEVIKKSGINKKLIEFVAYGIGPGSFVGVRLAASVCQAFAISLDIPVIGFSSMYAIAKSTQTNTSTVAVTLDAKMRNFYLGLYNKKNDVIISERIYKLDEYRSEIFDGYELIGEDISQIKLNTKVMKLNLDVVSLLDYISEQYSSQKKQGNLTNQTFPLYLSGTDNWNANCNK